MQDYGKTRDPPGDFFQYIKSEWRDFFTGLYFKLIGTVGGAD